METYFFIPANRLHKIQAIQKLNVDQIIIDLEDAVKTSEREAFIKTLENQDIRRDFYIRVPIYTIQNQLDSSLYLQLKKWGYTNFIFPKIKDIHDFELLKNELSTAERIILLIETPLFLVQLKEVLEKYHHLIKGIGLGSHDLMNYLGAEHTLTNLDYYRNYLLLHAKAYQVEAFDIASMELKDEDELKNEILDGFKKGFNSKFYIHPWQVELKDKIAFFTETDLEWASSIFNEYKKVDDAEEFNPIVVNGEIIEKPHLNKVFTILKYFRKYETE